MRPLSKLFILVLPSLNLVSELASGLRAIKIRCNPLNSNYYAYKNLENKKLLGHSKDVTGSSISPPLKVDRSELLTQIRRDEGTLTRRWGEFIQETAPLVTKVAGLWASNRLRRDDASLAKEVRKTLTNLGPTFVKFGQILSVREDVLGPVWSQELAKLQDSVEVFGGLEAFDMAMAAASDEEEKLIGSRLVEFGPNPVAVASIAQVHRGKWRQDENDEFLHDVAIKILRPNVVDQVATDLCVLLRAGDLLQEWAPRILPASRIDWRSLLTGFSEGLWEECDLLGEAERQVRFSKNMESVPNVFVPRVYASNPNMMVSEWVDGTPLRAIPSMDRRLIEAQSLMRDAYCQSMYIDGYFHADCHGGNLLWTEGEDGGKLCILDCGLMVDIESSAAEGLLRLSLHLAARDWTSVVQDFIALGFLPNDLSPNLLIEARGIFQRIIGPYLNVGGGVRAASAYSVSSLLDDLSSATVKLPISLPPSMVFLGRAVVQLEGLALRANPDYRLVDDILPVAARIALRSVPKNKLDAGNLEEERQSLLYDLLYESAADSPSNFRGTNENSADMQFSVEKLRFLLTTASRGDVSSTDLEASSSLGLPSTNHSLEDIVNELFRADAARELVAFETFNILDAIGRDALWRGADSLMEVVSNAPSLPFFPTLDSLPNFLSLPFPKKQNFETLAPRLCESEKLILLRLPKIIDDLDDTSDLGLKSTWTEKMVASLSPGVLPGDLKDSALAKLIVIPVVRRTVQEVADLALIRSDPNARATVDAILKESQGRIRVRLESYGLSKELSHKIASLLLRTPWKK